MSEGPFGHELPAMPGVKRFCASHRSATRTEKTETETTETEVTETY